MNPLAVAREFFSLQRAERTARAYAPGQGEAVRALVLAARRRRSAAKMGFSAWSEPASAALLRESLALYVRAAEVARDAALEPAAVDVAAALERIAERGRPPEGWRLAHAALAATDPLHLDKLDGDAFAKTRAALDRAARFVAAGVETRSVVAVRATRWGRAAAVLLVALYAVFAYARAERLAKNVAIGKKVTISSSHPINKQDPKTLVDGKTVRAWAFHTNDEEKPWALIDLLEPYTLERVVVHNRGDGWLETVLPLALELSMDGVTYTEAARREELFEPGHPWAIELPHLEARFLRLRTMRRAALALAAVEVYGTPLPSARPPGPP